MGSILIIEFLIYIKIVYVNPICNLYYVTLIMYNNNPSIYIIHYNKHIGYYNIIYLI